ncbi:MAG: LytTR family DNA-binding domain-containing protein [Lachnospiraceae bacterium]|nr:LytTR family DNA-binding domain-containing protein [Lachnospiraceae bacterium]
MRIAICDDDQQQLCIIRKEIEEYSIINKLGFFISTYTSAVNLLEDAVKESFNIIFLDISMPQMCGIEAAEHIRVVDTNVQIVFVTNLADYMPRGFDVMAAGFIVKPIREKAIYNILEKLINLFNRKNLTPYEVKLKGGQVGTIQLQDVLYMESNLHIICAFTRTLKCEYWGKLSEELKKLSQYGFVQCHRSYLINMAWVWIITDDCVTFTNNLSLSIGPKFRDNLKDTYRRYRK